MSLRGSQVLDSSHGSTSTESSRSSSVLRSISTVVAACLLPVASIALADSACPTDLDGSREVDFGDVALTLLDYGPCQGCTTDVDGTGEVDFGDVALVLLQFGPCPAWYTILDQDPDPSVVYDVGLRAAIRATGLPWRVRDNGTGIEMV